MIRKTIFIITIGLICLLLPQASFSQDIRGEWKCPDEMYQYWGYKVGKGKLSFNENNTFALELYGRNMLGHKFWPHRRMDLNVKGLYTAKNDSIYFYVNPDDIKCHVVGGREDPAMSPNYDSSNQRTTWNGSEVRYDSELRICEFQRISIINQMLDFFECKRYSFTKISQDSLCIGKKFVITRPND